MRFRIFAGLIAACILTLSAASAVAKEVQLYAEHYNSLTRESDPITNYHDSELKRAYGKIISQLEKALTDQSNKVIHTSDKTEADFQVVFVDIPFSYSEKPKNPIWKIPVITPPMSQNKHAAQTTARNLTSPWINATLYYQKGKIVGGDIFIPMAPFARLRQLYYASQDKWDEITGFSYELDNISVTKVLYKQRIENQEKKIRLSKDTSTVKLTQELGTSDIKATLDKLTTISHQTTAISFAGEVNYANEQCQKNAEPFFLSIYSHLITSMFQLTAPKPESIIQNTYYTFIPSALLIKTISAQSKNYNCFLHPTY